MHMMHETEDWIGPERMNFRFLTRAGRHPKARKKDEVTTACVEFFLLIVDRCRTRNREEIHPHIVPTPLRK